MILDKPGGLCRAAAAVIFAALASACAHGPAGQGGPGPNRLTVVVTISTIASLVQSVGGDKIDVRTLVPVGVSPETYDPRPSDLVAVSSARLIIENGAGLESWLNKLLRSAARPGTKILVLSSGMPVAERAPGDRTNSSGNPHLWLDPVFAQEYVRKIAGALRIMDPKDAAHYTANRDTELRRLKALDAWIRAQIATVSPQRRAAIVFHDAWYYFDRRYGIRDVGVIEPTPGAAPSAAYFAHLIALTKTEHITALFGEPQYSPKLVRQLAESAGIRTTSELYDDTLGSTAALSTYDAILRYDVEQMVKAMKT